MKYAFVMLFTLGIFLIGIDSAFADGLQYELGQFPNDNLFLSVNHTPSTPIAVGTSPIDIAVNERTNKIYTANNGAASISVINDDVINGDVTNISVEGNPAGIAVNEKTNTIYVTSDIRDGKISVINGTTNTVTDIISTGWTPSGIAVNEQTNTIYAALFIPSQVSVINGTTNTEINRISTGSWTKDVAVNEQTNTIYAANFRSGTVSVIDGTNTHLYHHHEDSICDHCVTDTISVGKYASSIAVNEVTNTVYVFAGSTVVVIDKTKNNSVIKIPDGFVGGITVDESNNTIYVTNQMDNTVLVIDGETKKVISRAIPVGNNPIAIAVNEETNTIYVANKRDNTVSVIYQNILNYIREYPPTLDAIADPAAIFEDDPEQTVDLFGIGGDGATQTLIVTATSDNTALIPNPTVTYDSPEATGSLSYTPVADAFGSAVITVTVSDGIDDVIQTFTVEVTSVNDLPVAVDDVDSVLEGGVTTTNIVSNDSDADDGLDLTSIAITSPPDNGSLFDNGDGTIQYTHDGSETLSDIYTYTINDNSAATSNPATVSITVTSVNDLPVAGDDEATVPEGGETTTNLALNDSDADDGLDLESIVIVTQPTNGALEVNADGTVKYTHDGSETTSDSYTYTIDDNTPATSNTATVDITITSSISLVDPPHNSISTILTLTSDLDTYYDSSGDIVLTATLNHWHGEEFIHINITVHSYDYVPEKPLTGNGGWYPTVHYGKIFTTPQTGDTVRWSLEIHDDTFPPYPNTITWKAVATYYPDESYTDPQLTTTIYFDTLLYPSTVIRLG